MAVEAPKYSSLPIPRPPTLRPKWTTWMWIAFAVAAVIATVIGIYYTATPPLF